MEYNNQESSLWYFPSGEDLEMTSASNAYVEMFKDTPLRSLAREICQNSLDAQADKNSPVKVSFDLFEIHTKFLPGFEQLKDVVLPSAHMAWPNEKKTQIMLGQMDKILSSEKIKILKISDYNTSGLEPENWKSLIEQAGSSIKNSDSSGGSFGIGKAAPFAVSDLRMVYYNTLTKTRKIESIGVMKFVSFHIKDNIVTQGVGYFGKNKSKSPFSEGVSFDTDYRKERGTDVYIIGFNTNNFSNWQEEIKYSIINDFLISMKRKQLEVEICGEKLSYDQIPTYLEEIKNNKRLTKLYGDFEGYYNTLEDSDSKIFYLTGFQDFKIDENEACLILSQNDAYNRKVLMTREAGMKIFDMKSFGSLLKFSGIFQATGPNINALLKKLENPNHDKWSEERHEDKKMAKKFLNQLTYFIRQNVKDTFQEKITEEVDAFGVGDFLPANLDSKNNSKRMLNKNLVSENLEVVLKELNVTNSLKSRSYEEGDLSEEELVKAGIVEGNENGNGFGNGQGDGLKVDGNGNGAGDGDNGENGVEELGGNIIKRTSSRKSVSDIKYRIIERDLSNGKYRLIINSSSTLNKVKIYFNIIGDSGNKSTIKINAAHQNGSILTVYNSYIFIDKINAEQWTAIDVLLENKTRLKLEVEVYEVN
ncbi:hypothetical protein [Macrococcus bovicus]|uniref:hypothetical protein n=1 Tax=Macrococcus bovicus TaxID=69968 RepID=UPI0025A5846B|nr:hypothetical protein [Macrococcus bovicus]WJP97269.1 hypothetical protein QSV55_08255 [Macrococcus bovicus]